MVEFVRRYRTSKLFADEKDFDKDAETMSACFIHDRLR